MMILLVGGGLLALGVAAWMLALACVPPRTVAQMLYDTEQATRSRTR